MAIAICIIGCGGSSDQPELGQVKGKVTLDGQPVADATVFFWPADGGRTVSTTTDANGDYELKYVGDDKGTKVGKNKVRVSTQRDGDSDEDGNPTEPRKETIPAKYNTETQLEFDVTPGENVINLELTSD
ncbi:MAG: carboxypeptidase regulatory-like domain-containing protein [Planctomycetaceae bacterium]|nr:carboxypeptidase regulatory-like domain-containing protein [Planctomycetaceae bacterium]